MRARARLDRLEEALTPLGVVRLWLVEVQAFGSLPAYVAWCLREVPARSPLTRLVERIEAAVRRAHRGEDRETTRAAVDEAIRIGLARALLVLAANEAVVREAADAEREHATLTLGLTVVVLEQELATARGTPAGRTRSRSLLRAWTAAIGAHVAHLDSVEAAIGLVQERWFGGTPILFDDASALLRAAQLAARELVEQGEEWRAAVRSGGSGEPAIGVVERRLAAARRAGAGQAASVAADLEGTARRSALALVGDDAAWSHEAEAAVLRFVRHDAPYSTPGP